MDIQIDDEVPPDPQPILEFLNRDSDCAVSTSSR
jgi:hypothetical protein